MILPAEENLIVLHRDKAVVEPVLQNTIASLTTANTLTSPAIAADAPPLGVSPSSPKAGADPAPDSSPQLALPRDLWEDFQALQAATHLDTTALIRRLIHQYGRAGSQTDNDRPSSATDTDTTICADDQAPSSPCTDGGETAYFTEQAACLAGGDNMGTLPPPSDYPPGQSASADYDDDEDCVILDLSSGVRVAQQRPSSPDRDSGVYQPQDEGEDGAESPLDLTVSKPRAGAAAPHGMEVLFGQAPEAHRAPLSNTILLSALSGLGRSQLVAPPTSHPRESPHHHMAAPSPHPALSADVPPSPRLLSASSLFNLSELPLATGLAGGGGHHRVSAGAQTEQAQSKPSSSSVSAGAFLRFHQGEVESLQSHGKPKMVQHFLSLPASHLQLSEVQTHDRQARALPLSPHGSSEALLRRARGAGPPVSVPGPNPNLSPSLLRVGAKCGQQAQFTAATAGGVPATEMQLPTVTSLEFPADAGGKTGLVVAAGVEGAGVGGSAVAVPFSSLPASASALLLDVSGGGLVGVGAGGGGGAGGMSTLNFPLMTTAGGGGLVAIPFLHAFPPEQLHHAPASHPPASTSQQPPPPPPPLPMPHHDLPPPPPYSAAVAASTGPGQAKKYGKAKTGRPRGQPKAPKAAPAPENRDMKLLTENTLFPGVYTSILKLPWSKRSRGKSSSVKIKDVVGKPTPTSASAPVMASSSLVAGEQKMEIQEPGEIVGTVPQQQQQQRRQRHHQEETPHTSSASNVATPLGIFSMPLIVPDQTSSSVSSTVLSSSSPMSSSVMMVYQNSVMSEVGGKAAGGGRKRGRPPKLPVLSQLLTESSAAGAYGERVQDCGNEDDNDPHPPTAIDAGSFSFINLAAHPAFNTSAVAFPTNMIGDFAAAGLPQEALLAGIKQEPMEVTESSSEAVTSNNNKLFSLSPSQAVLVRKEDFGGNHHHHHDLHGYPPGSKPDRDDGPVTSCELRYTDGRRAEAMNVETTAADRAARNGGVRNPEVKETDVTGVYGIIQETTGDTTTGGGSGRGGEGGGGGGGGDSFQDSSLETRFHMLANRLGLELGSPYHTSLVYGHSPSAAAKNFLYQPVMLPTSAAAAAAGSPMVEMKPRRRQLNNLIKPSDDCVYTSFRIRPRNSGRRGGKRGGGGGRRSSRGRCGGGSAAAAIAAVGSCSKLGGVVGDCGEDLQQQQQQQAKEATVVEGENDGGGARGSAVITERIPGAGEVPQRLYQDLYHCKTCGELLPVDTSQPHTCPPHALPLPLPLLQQQQQPPPPPSSSSSSSPPLCACQVCGALFLSSSSSGPTHPLPDAVGGGGLLCEDCVRKSQRRSPTTGVVGVGVEEEEESSGASEGRGERSEGFACQPCGVQFVHITDYIQHRRSAHLDQPGGRQAPPPRRTHALKTLPCPQPGCPRLFHMHAELSRHLLTHHHSNAQDREGKGGEEEEEGGHHHHAAAAGDIVVGGGGGGGGGGDGTPILLPPPPPSPQDDVDVETVFDKDADSGSAPAPAPTAVADPEAQFLCPQPDCSRRFPDSLQLLEHLQDGHEGLDRWPCPLPGCTRQFGTDRHLRVHLLMHKDEKPLRCPLCPYRCRQRNALTWHLRKHPESAAGQYRKFAGVTGAPD